MQLSQVFVSLSLAASTLASPALPWVQRRQENPVVLYPDDGVVWVVGSTHNVTWNPAGQESTEGVIFLAKHSFVDPEPVAVGVDTTTGRIEVTVPDVEPATDYNMIMVIGGAIAGPASGPFTIAESRNNLPESASFDPEAETTIVFPGTTIVATPPFDATVVPTGFASVTSSAASEVSEAASSVASDASSVISSLSDEQSSVQDEATSALSSIGDEIESATDAVESPVESEVGEEGAALSLAPGSYLGAVAVLAIAMSAGAMIL
ncbi:hypothetical protein BDV98DRAFT_584337 [Pterulicium gracile]|uniref:Ser-Thr-rich glycosyl-phosphatidyl-inositol-anchored membrane family-domain-containing protein n=1 Tax=Pterulicium gracile TaxID=1884261 RepID=A0A5C3QGS9_9AGAR|nr:hypothetical protein BDV98DRAFT_584337 [Pterula gracilis]